jgi:hypothetical protein
MMPTHAWAASIRRSSSARHRRPRAAAPPQAHASVSSTRSNATDPQRQQLAAAPTWPAAAATAELDSTLDWLDADIDTPCWTVLIEQRGLIEWLLEPDQR